MGLNPRRFFITPSSHFYHTFITRRSSQYPTSTNKKPAHHTGGRVQRRTYLEPHCAARKKPAPQYMSLGAGPNLRGYQARVI
jgi:hypothetical protein